MENYAWWKAPAFDTLNREIDRDCRFAGLLFDSSVEAETMRYLLLVHHAEDAFALIAEEQQRALREESVALANQLQRNGQYLGAAPLHPTSTATCVRLRDNRRLITDGPFAETREQLGGYFLVEAAGLEEALDIAARIPGARLGGVEVRQVLGVGGLPDVS